MGTVGAKIPSYHVSSFSGKQYAERHACLECPLDDCADRKSHLCPITAEELAWKEEHTRRAVVAQKAQGKAELDAVLREFTQGRIVGRALRRV